jgi:hypothetical protein
VIVSGLRLLNIPDGTESRYGDLFDNWILSRNFSFPKTNPKLWRKEMKTRRITAFVLLFVILCSLPLAAQKMDIQVDGKRIHKIITHMASDQFRGRKPNTPEFFQVQEWVVQQYKNWGLEPAGENGTYYQSVPISRNYAVTYGTPRMIVNGREYFSRFGDFRIDTRSTTGKTVNGGIVFAGYGISAPEKGLDEYAGLDVKGKIVFVFKGSPADFEPPRSWFSPRDEGQEEPEEDWKKEARDTTKMMTAYDKGAAGIIFFGEDADESPMRRTRSVVERSPFEKDFIVVSEVSEPVFRWIFWTDDQMSERGFEAWINNIRGDIKKKKARSFTTEATAGITGYQETLLKGKKFDDGSGRNIIARITGTDPKLRDEYVVIGAHFDHVGVTAGQIYNGADDNASGSGVVMELARLMKQHKIRTKRSVIFCLWTAEELGLIGSRYWVKNPTDGVTMDQVVTYFNMDMVGLGDQIGAPGALNFPSIWEVIKKDQDPGIMEAVQASEGGPGGSDHSAFIELGIEALALMTRGGVGHPDYHDTGDDADKIDPVILEKTGQFVLQATLNLANETETQLLIPGRQDLYDGLRWMVTVIDPSLEVRGGWSVLEAGNEAELTQLLIEKMKELKQPKQESNRYRAYFRWMRRTNLGTGIRGARTFNHDIHFMHVAKEALNFGRVDIVGDDGIWFKGGLTEAGVSAVKAMQDSNIVIHLIQPSRKTLQDILAGAEKPFLVSGFSDFDDNIAAQINEKDVLISVDFDPQDVAGCVARLEKLKARFGDTDNLVLKVLTNENLGSAKRSLYMRLLEKGWEKKEIYAIGGSGTTRRSQGNFDRFSEGNRRSGGFPGF